MAVQMVTLELVDIQLHMVIDSQTVNVWRHDENGVPQSDVKTFSHEEFLRAIGMWPHSW